MRDVSIIGAGITKFGELWDKSLRELGLMAGLEAIQDADISSSDIDALYVGNMAAGSLVQQEHVSALIADYCAMAGAHVPSTRIEGASAPGGLALRQAYMAVAGGFIDVAVVGGAEKMTDVSDSESAHTLSMGADELVLLQDDAFENTIDSFLTAQLLAAAVRKLDGFDLIICGRQASDWDNAQVPLGVAELLGMSCISLGKRVDVIDGKVRVERIIADGYEVVEAALPALVTVSNELGQPRYPTLRGILAATRKKPTIWSAADLDLDAAQSASRIPLRDLFVPVSDQECEITDGEDPADSGRLLAMKLREDKVI
mgnify:CR=1 FL=1